MIGLDEAALNAELDAAISRVKKLNNNVDEMGDNRADHSCQYFCARDGETPAECSQMNALYCKIGECPLRKEQRTRPAIIFFSNNTRNLRVVFLKFSILFLLKNISSGMYPEKI